MFELSGIKEGLRDHSMDKLHKAAETLVTGLAAEEGLHGTVLALDGAGNEGVYVHVVGATPVAEWPQETRDAIHSVARAAVQQLKGNTGMSGSAEVA